MVPSLADGPLEDIELTKCWEFKTHDQIENVRGKLRANIKFWENNLEPAAWILECIRDGYRLPLKEVYIRSPLLGAICLFQKPLRTLRRIGALRKWLNSRMFVVPCQ